VRILGIFRSLSPDICCDPVRRSQLDGCACEKLSHVPGVYLPASYNSASVHNFLFNLINFFPYQQIYIFIISCLSQHACLPACLPDCMHACMFSCMHAVPMYFNCLVVAFLHSVQALTCICQVCFLLLLMFTTLLQALWS